MVPNPITRSLSGLNPKVLLCAIACLGAAASAGETTDDRSSASETENSLRAGKDFWSFQPITRPSPPLVQVPDWPQTKNRTGSSPTDLSRPTMTNLGMYDLFGDSRTENGHDVHLSL